MSKTITRNKLIVDMLRQGARTTDIVAAVMNQFPFASEHDVRRNIYTRRYSLKTNQSVTI